MAKIVFRANELVVLVGLQNRPELNGQVSKTINSVSEDDERVVLLMVNEERLLRAPRKNVVTMRDYLSSTEIAPGGDILANQSLSSSTSEEESF